MKNLLGKFRKARKVAQPAAKPVRAPSAEPRKKPAKSDAEKLAERLAGTGLFDAHWYLETYPEVKLAGQDPLTHYLEAGEKAGMKPNPYFDPVAYLAKAKAAQKFSGPALLHYALHGWKNGRSPSPLFSAKLYLEEYPDVADAGHEPLAHYLSVGRTSGYLALPQYLGNKQGRADIKAMRAIHEAGLFDPLWYKAQYTDLWYGDMDPLFHFVRHGARERRDPNPFFATRWYMDRYGDLVGDENPLVYYARQGHQLGHATSPKFCGEAYARENSDVEQSGLSPLAHYLKVGAKEGRKAPAPKPAKSGKPVRLPVSNTLRGMMDFEKRPLAPTKHTFDAGALNIHWVVPDFAAGGGGHMTIFRMVHHLEVAGHRQTIWINDPSLHKSPEAAYETICKYFQHFAGDVRFLDDSFAAAEGDAIIATDCWTVWPVLSATRFTRRFYFVQDYEPSFHPMGANYLVAEATYREDLDCICAGPWLAKLMQEKYGRWARHFWLAADRDLYVPPAKKRKNRIPRIAVYARHFTARRAVELAFLALEALAARGVKFKVDFFGAPLELDSAPFEFVDHGIASPEALAGIFQKADVGLVFSATNYSLVPQEMMACQLPIVELKGDNTASIFPPDTVTLADPHPKAIADALDSLLSDAERRQAQADAARDWVAWFSWGQSAKLVEAAITERLGDFAKALPSETVQATAPKASVVIPTLNAGPVLDRVLAAVTTQEAPWPYEVLVVDSGSTDGTLETVAKYPTVRLHQIGKADFNHGATRNLGAELTSGDFIAFLTHDAMPANEHWLFNLVTAVEHYPDAAGAFGRHLPWPDASEFTKRDLNAHFENFLKYPLCVSRETDRKRYDKGTPAWRQMLHFYSDNNSCMRRAVWEEIPYRTVKFGEDQLWADDIVKAGYGKVYAVQAVVYHSHDYDAAETRERNMTEAAFFKHFFGYELMKDEKTLGKTLAALNDHDRTWGKDHGLSDADIERRCTLNEARLQGYLDGCMLNTGDMF